MEGSKPAKYELFDQRKIFIEQWKHTSFSKLKQCRNFTLICLQ